LDDDILTEVCFVFVANYSSRDDVWTV